MFKKEPHVKALSNLKNSERKKLLQTCKEQTGCSEYSFASAIVKQTNYKGQHSSGSVYTDENNVPIWFKEKHGELLFPTVYSCWSFPKLLPIVLTHDFVIEERIFNGANLMLAGTVPPFDPRCEPATVCGIASRDNPTVVLAVGVVQLNLPTYDSVIGQHGIAVQVMHYLTDGLCQVFKMDLEPPLRASGPTEGDKEDAEAAEELDLSRDISQTAVRIEDVAEVLDELSVEDVDNFFTRALYYTLTQDTNLELPITASNFISAHVLPNLPPVDPTQVNMKKTSWKKSAKYLKQFEKAGFLQLKGKGDDLVIVGVDKDKDELKSFVPYKTSADSSTRKGQCREKPAGSPDAMYSEKYYKPINLGKDFVQCTSLPPKLLYSVPDLRDSLNEYITTQKLVDSRNKKMVLLDDLLYDLVNKRKKAQDAPRCISRAQILEPFLSNNFTEFFQIFKDGAPLFKSPAKGSLPHVKIVTEMKIGRKVVTRVSNFELFKVNTDELAADLRKLCSGSTTVGETLSSPRTAEVQVQGAHGSLIIEHLNSKGIPSKWIDFESKLKNKKKRPT
ncbi:hypothetical protein HG536_0C01850 [Torulaspora globosa]|uniref:SUI1 domain-containing protein n=1 Tax=Torulaspora globosa TaxID=48254 RepID=A0A7G3ZET1_9SACH|nr:uncharacterized protein HG536_0C01850 [Torulaspora globosa]QLL32017.1 hypothetical protein HG536_0C01850 [Torulaspora globosa]